MGKTKCPECHKSPYFEDKGDGLCPECHGIGSTHDWARIYSYFVDKYPCKRCHGTGKCPTCDGSGFVSDDNDTGKQ